MSTFDIYVKVSILINYKTKQPSNLAWNISLTSWLCNIGVRFSVCLSIRPSVCQHLCRSSTFMSKLVFLSHLLVAGCDIGVRFSVRPSVRPSVSPSVSPSVHLSTFMSTFDIYVKVSILINYKTKQPSNLAWNISLTSWLCNIGVRFSVCLSIRPSVCQHLCRRSTFMSKLIF